MTEAGFWHLLRHLAVSLGIKAELGYLLSCQTVSVVKVVTLVCLVTGAGLELVLLYLQVLEHYGRLVLVI